MGEPFIGSEALAAGRVTPYQLRSKFDAVHRDVYLPRGSELTAATRATAAWLWSGRAGVIAGQSAAALHGAKWVDARRPAELLYPNRRPPSGIRSWSDRYEDDEVQPLAGGLVLTTPARTALDIACRYPPGPAVAAIDALARATKLKTADVEMLAQRYRGRRGIRAALEALDLVDAGAESPQETRVRLVLVKAGFPRPETQIPVYDEYGQLVAVIDMGWRDLRVGVDYDGAHHRMSRRQFDRDVRRYEAVAESGWDDVRITGEDTDGSIIGRVGRAFDRRT
jgi:YD repeat-containing protein